MNKKTTIGIIIAILIFAGMGLQIYFADQRIESLEIGTKGHLELLHHYPLTTGYVILQHVIDSCYSDDIWFKTRCQQTLSKHIMPEHTPRFNFNDYVAILGGSRGHITNITYTPDREIFDYTIISDSGYYEYRNERDLVLLRAFNLSD